MKDTFSSAIRSTASPHSVRLAESRKAASEAGQRYGRAGEARRSQRHPARCDPSEPPLPLAELLRRQQAEFRGEAARGAVMDALAAPRRERLSLSQLPFPQRLAFGAHGGPDRAWSGPPSREVRRRDPASYSPARRSRRFRSTSSASFSSPSTYSSASPVVLTRGTSRRTVSVTCSSRVTCSGVTTISSCT